MSVHSCPGASTAHTARDDFRRIAFLALAVLFGATTVAAAPLAPVDGAVRALVVFQGDLIAAGDFTIAGEVPAQHIARWDGSNWHPMGDGTDGPVYALAAFGGRLFAGGDFTTAGSVSASNLALWEGGSWSAIGSGTDGPVHALATRLGIFLYVGGSFTQAGGVPANNVAEWFNGDWSAMGPGLDGTITSLTLHNNLVWAGGPFQFVDTVLGQIAFFTTNGWEVGNIAIEDGEVHVVADVNGLLVAGGRFEQVWWNTKGRSVKRKVGPLWQPLSFGLTKGESLEPGEVFAMTGYAGGIVAGGLFDKADSLAARNIAFYDGSFWAPFGAGVDGAVLTAVEYAGALVVGGEFEHAGSISAPNIALWDGAVWTNDMSMSLTALQELRVDALADGVNLSWTLQPSAVANLAGVAVQRALHGVGPYATRSERLHPASRMGWSDAAVDPGGAYWYRLRFESVDGEVSYTRPTPVQIAGRGAAVGLLSATDPGAGQPVQIRYRLERPADVRLEIFDARGRSVRLLETASRRPGEYVRSWDRYDAQGQTVARGVYFVHLGAGTTRSSRRLILLSR